MGSAEALARSPAEAVRVAILNEIRGLRPYPQSEDMGGSRVPWHPVPLAIGTG